MSNSSPERNKAIVLEAFETLFNKRDYAAAERFWLPNYIQHSAHIAPGREGLFNLVRSVPETLHCENQLIIAESDYVIVHGRLTGMGRPAAWIAADVVRFEDGLLKEHWDVLQEEATKAKFCQRPSYVRRHIPQVTAEDNAIALKAFDTLFTRPKEVGTMTSSVVSNEMYVILGASGHTGSVIANSLLSAGKKVRVVGRDSGRLQRFVDKGAEAFTANLSDAAAVTKAFSDARAAYLMLPPAKSREGQERDSDGIAKAVKESGLRYAVHLSSYGAQVAEGAGPVSGLHSSEQKLNAISGSNVLHLRAAYFMENNLAAIGMIHGMGIFGNALLPDLKEPLKQK